MFRDKLCEQSNIQWVSQAWLGLETALGINTALIPPGCSIKIPQTLWTETNKKPMLFHKCGS